MKKRNTKKQKPKKDSKDAFTLIEQRLKKTNKEEKMILTHLYLAIDDAIQYHSDSMDVVSQNDEFSIDKKNEEINYELDIIKTLEVFKDILSNVIGPKYLVKAGLWEERERSEKH